MSSEKVLLIRHRMERRNISEILIKQNLIQDYAELKNMNAIAKKYGVSNVTIKTYLVKYGIQHKRQVRYNCDHDLFSRDNEYSFYIAGLLAADGNLRITKGTYYVRLMISEKDIDLVKIVKNICKAEAPITIRTRDHSVIRGVRCNSSSLACLEISSRKMFDDLLRFNVVPNKTRSFTIPEWMIDHPLANHFLRGLADGDGCFYVKKKSGLLDQLNFSIIGTVREVEAYRSILERYCDLPFVNRKIYKNRGCGVLSYGGNGVVGKIASFLYRDASIFLQRKYDLAMQAKLLAVQGKNE